MLEHEKKTVFRAIHTALIHVDAETMAELIKLEEQCRYAGMQLGTASQARAATELHNAIDAAIDTISPYYLEESANYIRGA